MRVHYLQHVPFEPPGTIERWAADRGHDAGAYPWLAEEKRFIERAIEAGGVVVGICLGAQVVAEALGAEV